eukprot:1148406-Pelagomonas_calceolata.AAC.1
MRPIPVASNQPPHTLESPFACVDFVCTSVSTGGWRSSLSRPCSNEEKNKEQGGVHKAECGGHFFSSPAAMSNTNRRNAQDDANQEQAGALLVGHQQAYACFRVQATIA